MKFKETAEDLAVKDRLWSATEREIERFVQDYASGHVTGEAYSDAQRDATSAAKAKGYPIGLIRKLGAIVRREEWHAPPLHRSEAEISLPHRFLDHLAPAPRSAAGATLPIRRISP